MKNKKFWPVVLVLIAICSFLAFQTTQAKSSSDDPKEKNEKILQNLGVLLEQAHYSPRKIDDAFSKLVLNRFENDLDGDKSIFLQTDIDAFKKYETTIDDEIHGTTELQSFYDISAVYTKRITEASKSYASILSKPFDYTIDEEITLDGDKLNFPQTDAGRQEVWRKRLKYLALGKYVDMLDEREKNKGKKILFTRLILH